MLDRLSAWLEQHHLPATVLKDKTGATVGLTYAVTGAHPGPRWVLDACLDTAPLGDEHAWTHPPTSAAIDDGWLYGRGSADSKPAAAIFCHLAARLDTIADRLCGSLVLLFDVDEHTGGFGGAKRYFEGPDAPDDVAGVMTSQRSAWLSWSQRCAVRLLPPWARSCRCSHVRSTSMPRSIGCSA